MIVLIAAELTTKEAADELNVTSETIRRYIEQGDLKANRKPRGKRMVYSIPATEIDNFKQKIAEGENR